MSDQGNEPIPGVYICETCGHAMTFDYSSARKCRACGSDYVRKARVRDDPAFRLPTKLIGEPSSAKAAEKPA
jgi:DNA-directed RNA polymerase subunit RPC12/RpoP